MNALKHIWLTFIQLLKQMIALPTTISSALTARQQRIEWKAMEAERLDRIRNPSKYRGK